MTANANGVRRGCKGGIPLVGIGSGQTRIAVDYPATGMTPESTPAGSSSPRVHRPLRGGLLVRWALLLSLVAVLIGEFLYSPVAFPDYESYQGIYNIGGENFATTFNGVVFAKFIELSRATGLDYVAFRHLQRLVSIALLLWALIRIDRWAAVVRGQAGLPLLGSLGLSVLLGGAVYVFGLEFFQVRIRAGLSISLISCAFALLLTRRGSFPFWRVLLPVGLLTLLAFGVHMFTGIILFYMLMLPMALGAFVRVLRRHLAPWSMFGISGAIFLSAALAFLLYLTSNASDIRGADLISPLNRVRLLAVGVIPVLLVGATFMLMSGTIRRFFQAQRRSDGRALGRRQDLTMQRKRAWLFFASLQYFVLSVALLGLDFAGFTGEAGEALVRIFTLGSVPALFVIFLRPTFFSILWIFLLLSNSLFFVNTLLTAK